MKNKNEKLDNVEYLSYFKDRFDDYKQFMDHVKKENNAKYLELNFKEFVELSILVGNSLFIEKDLYYKNN